jgi:hypothetical protein
MACERVQFSKKTHGDGAGIVRKLDANRKRIPAACASSGQSKTILVQSYEAGLIQHIVAAPRLAVAGEVCLTSAWDSFKTR